MVSVIIDACNSHKFLVRSVNSIRRQVYKDIEIIVVAKDNIESLSGNDVKLIVAQNLCKGLKDAVEVAKGQKIYFCSSNSVLTYNVIGDLVDIASDTSLCVYTKSYIKTQNDYTLYMGVNVSLYGKLTDRDSLIKVLSDKYNSQAEIAVSYMKQCAGVVTADSAVLYESCTDREVCEIVMGTISESALKNCLKEVADAGMEPAVRNYITAGLGEFIATLTEDAEDIMFYISSTMPQDIWLNYSVGRKTVNRWWNTIQGGNNTKIYKKFIDYISSFEDELIKMFLKNCEINKEIFEIMKANEQNVFLDIYNGIKEDIDTVAVRVVAPVKNNTQQYSYELSGMQLADYVVDKYRSGSLGLKTFFKSFGAWIKFKLKR